MSNTNPWSKLRFYKNLSVEFSNEFMHWRRPAPTKVQEAIKWIGDGNFIIYCKGDSDKGTVINKTNIEELNSI